MSQSNFDLRHDGESAFSVARRYADVVRLPPSVVFEPAVRAEIEQGRSPIRPGDAEYLNARWGVAAFKPGDMPEPLSRMWVSMNGVRVPRRSIETASAKICPECIREAAYWRSEWDLAYSLACTRHDVWLTGTCPHCRRNLSYLTGSAVKCACGFDLRSLIAEPCDAHSLKLATLLSMKLDGAAAGDNRAAAITACLQSLNYSDLTKLVDFVQYHCGTEDGQASRHLSGIADLELRQQRFALAAACLLGDDDVLHERLDTLFKVRPDQKLDLLRYGRRFYDGLFDPLNESALRPLQTRFRRWIERLRSCGPTRRGAPRVLRDHSSSEVATLCEAQRLTGLSRSRIRHEVERGRIKATVRGSGPTRLFRIDRGSLLAFSQLPQPWRTDGRLSDRDLAERLGISVPAVRRLRDKGHLDGGSGAQWRMVAIEITGKPVMIVLIGVREHLYYGTSPIVRFDEAATKVRTESGSIYQLAEAGRGEPPAGHVAHMCVLLNAWGWGTVLDLPEVWY